MSIMSCYNDAQIDELTLDRDRERDRPTVFVVDDDPAIRKSLGMMLEAHCLRWEEYPSADEFLDQFDAARPGCLVLDLRMPGTNGEDALRRLREAGARMPVIVLTGHGDVVAAVRTMKLGLVDFLQKPVEHSILIQNVREALRQDGERRRRDAQYDALRHRIRTLTPRELQLLAMLANGKTSKEIAGALDVSVKTVDNHRAHLLEKLQASNVAELSAMAVRAGIA
jgi:two-component system, LuxR family, response regulator FixJ